VLLLGLLAICAAPTLAAPPAASPAASAPAAAVPEEPEPVTQWTQAALGKIGQARSSLASTAVYDQQSAAYTAIATRFESQFERFVADPDALQALSDVALEDAAHELNVVAKTVAGIEQAVEVRAAAIEEQLRQLTDLAEQARTQRRDRAASILPEALHGRLERIVTEADPLIAIARERLNAVAKLQNECLALSEHVDTLQQGVASTTTARLRGLLRFDQTPLWRVTGTEVALSAEHSSELALNTVSSTVGEFVRDEAGRVLLHVLLFGWVLWLMRALRRAQRTDPNARVASRALERPISASVLIAILVTPLLYLDAPLVLRSVAGIVMLAAALRMLTLYADRTLWRKLFALTGLAIFIRVLTAVSLEALVDRLAMLTVSATTIAVLLWAMRAHVERALGLSPPRQRYVRWLLGVSALVSLVSAVFNVFGNASLGGVLQTAAVYVLVLAAGMYAAVRVLNEMAQLIAEVLERRGVRSVIRHRRRFVAALTRLNGVFGFLVWLYYAAILYRLDEPLNAAIRATLAAQWTIGTVTLSLGRLLAFGVAVWLAIRASRVTQIVLNDDVLPQFPLPRGVPNAISMLVNYAIVLIGIFVAAGILGIGLSNLALIVGALGVGIGFGLQNVVNNFVSGLILLFERPVQVGDAVQLGSLGGRITRIGFRASYIRTYGGAEVVVPNGDLVSTQLVNWTLSDRRRRLELTVGIAYGSDPERVTEVLAGVLKADPEVLVDPAPFIVFEAFGDSALNFRMYAWIADFENGLTATHRLNTAIAAALAAEGIEIPFPQRDVHLKSVPAAS
jgi:potassium-dependent mechanosensitive channel